MGAPPGQQNRTPLFVALGVLGVAAVILLIVLVASGGDDDDGPTAGATTTQDQPATTDDTDITLPDDGGGNGGGPVTEGDLAVAESGFSEYKESFSNDKFTAYGAVIQNNGDQVARNVDVEIGFLDASGTVLATDTKYITVLKPGQKFCVGGTSVDATGVTELSVTASASDSDDPADYGDLTVEGVSVEFDSDGAPTANFTVKSTYTDKLDGPNLYAIFRDGSGKIVGGDYDFMDFIPAGADAVGSVTSFAPIANIDGTKTEIYVDPNIF